MRGLWLGLADVVVAIHYAFMVYLAVGGFIAWRWRKTIAGHVLAVAWAVVIVTAKLPCPLTALQNQFRENAGERPLSSSFIDLYVRGTLFPSQGQTISQLVLGLVVLASWIGYASRARRHHDRCVS